MTGNAYPETPTLDRMLEIREKSQAVGEFIEWLAEERGIHLGRHTHHSRIQIEYANAEYERQIAEKEIEITEAITQAIYVDKDILIDQYVAGGRLAPECWGKDPDCPDLDHPSHKPAHHLTPVHTNIERLLADFFKIDGKEADREKAAVYAHIRKLNAARPAN